MSFNRPRRTYFEFVRLPTFEQSVKGMLSEEEIREVETDLLESPERGDRIPGACGVRKLRAAMEGRGKRGGGRVIYLYVESRARIYLLLAYPKNKTANLTEAEKKDICQLVGLLTQEK